MIERYSLKEMSSIWKDESKFAAMLQVEIASLHAFVKMGKVPEEDYKKVKENAKFDVKTIREIEKETKHDVIAFTRNVSQSLGEEKKWVHYGLTSTDVVDTANGILLKKANEIIKKDLDELIAVLKKQAIKYKNTPIIGRTHGIHADITTFGLKWALWYDEMLRNKKRFEEASKDVEVGKISGAVGNFCNVDPFIQDSVCEELGLSSAKISTQTLQRDRYAYYLATLALIATSLEKIAFEIRLLQQSEIHELEEYFSKGQKGSSAMPHKRNPITSENIVGCARVMRGYMIPAYEDVALWHERDISHSSVERIILADATTLLDYMLSRYTKCLDNLIVYEDKMKENIYLTHKQIFAQRLMNAIIEKGHSREESYDLVQSITRVSYDNNLDFEELVNKNEEVLKILNKKEIKDCFTLDYYFKNVDEIYKRVGIK